MASKSRYASARAFEGADGADPVYFGTRPREIVDADGVLEHTVVRGDRLDALARYYYNDDRLWWRIVDANPEILCGGDLVADPEMIGSIIRIPKARD